ncbi:MAG: hypothetical protein FWG10_13120 [Eubacteriaceae bacterium]|nr:hypothetical protein [Eubacteriaceae bacterium]
MLENGIPYDNDRAAIQNKIKQMNLANIEVVHSLYGNGVVIQNDEKYLDITFSIGEKRFIFPDAFDGFLVATDPEVSKTITGLLQEIQEVQKLEEMIRIENERKRELELQNSILVANTKTKSSAPKTNQRENIAFKCNYCDGGQSEGLIGFSGVCTDETIKNNIEVDRRTWCKSNDCPCFQYHNNQITREQLEASSFVCYESRMLADWKAYAGIIQNGDNKGRTMKLTKVQTNSLCILTTRNPGSPEKSRFIFAVFLVDNAFVGDSHEEGYVSTNSSYKLVLSPSEAQSILFWNYHANASKPENPVWSSGLHRYIKNIQAAQILRDIANIKADAPDREFALDLFNHFCEINQITETQLEEPVGALQIQKNFNSE